MLQLPRKVWIAAGVRLRMRSCVAALVSIGLASCGGGDSGTESASSATVVGSPAATPTPAPSPSPTPTPTSSVVSGPLASALTAIASNFDITSELQPAWGTGAVPASNAPDNVGAFRFICNASHESKDDPIVYPGQPGKSHLHEFFGNTLTDANSTYQSLRTTGDSTCGNRLNRSAYWQPAMLDGHGNVVRPDFWQIYYKRLPATSSDCAKIAQRCAPIPDGLRFIFGYDMVTMTAATGAVFFQCVTPDGLTGTGGGSDMAVAEQGCVAPNQLEVRLHAPDCWDGIHLDSGNHRDHVSYSAITPGTDGQPHCPAGYPVLIPTFTLAAFYTVDKNLADWRFSSDDDMKAAPGTTFHSDFYSAWDPGIEAIWTNNCIDKLLNCSGGDLGNGQQLKPFAGFSWNANPRLVPIS